MDIDLIQLRDSLIEERKHASSLYEYCKLTYLIEKVEEDILESLDESDFDDE